MVWQSLSARPHKLRSKRGCQCYPVLLVPDLRERWRTSLSWQSMPQRSTQLEETKYSFYDDLQDAVGGVPAGNMLIVAGHWNARPGPVDTATWHTLDKFAVGASWANGDHLVNMTSANRLVVSHTRFQHTQRGVMVVASTWRRHQPSFEGANATDQTGFK